MSDRYKGLHIPLRNALNTLDSETQTYGCRANNPDICSNNGILGICAFVSDDHICRKPSRAWKKIFKELKNE